MRVGTETADLERSCVQPRRRLPRRERLKLLADEVRLVVAVLDDDVPEELVLDDGVNLPACESQGLFVCSLELDA